jgi:hypothetical protein
MSVRGRFIGWVFVKKHLTLVTPVTRRTRLELHGLVVSLSAAGAGIEAGLACTVASPGSARVTSRHGSTPRTPAPRTGGEQSFVARPPRHGCRPTAQRGSGAAMGCRRWTDRPLTGWCTVVLALALEAARAQGAAVSFDGDCLTQEWFQRCGGLTNWSNEGFPGPGDDVSIAAGFPVRTSSGERMDIDVRSLTAAGGLLLGGVDLAVQEASEITGLDLNSTISSARAMSAGPGVTFRANWIWRGGGALRGAGATAEFRNAGSVSLVAGPGVVTRALLVNDGELIQTGSLALAPDASVRNLRTWTLTSNNDDVVKLDPLNDPDVALFDNRGSLRVTGGSSSMEVVFVSDAPATIDATLGQLTFRNQSIFGSPITVAAGARIVSQPPTQAPQLFRGATLSGGGEFALNGGVQRRHRVEGQVASTLGPAPGGLLLANVDLELAAGATLANSGVLRWSGGTVHGFGEWSNATVGELYIQSAGRLAARLFNGGVVVQTQPVTIEDADVFEDQPAILITVGGEWRLTESEILAATSALRGRVRNAGTLRVEGTRFRSRITARYDLAPEGTTIVAENAVLGLLGGGVWTSPTPFQPEGAVELQAPASNQPREYVNAAEATVSGFGRMAILDHATLRLDAPLTTALGRVRFPEPGALLRGGTILGPGPLRNERTLTAERGQLGATGDALALENEGGAILLVTGSDVALTGTLTNRSSVLEAGGGVYIADGARLALREDSLIDNAGFLQLNGTSVIDGSGRLVNRDFLVKNRSFLGPIGRSVIGVPLDNLGGVDVVTGVLELAGGVQQVQGNVLTGGRWYVYAGAQLVIRNAAITTIGPGANVGVGGSMPGDALAGLRRVDGTLTVFGSLNADGLDVGPSGTCVTFANSPIVPGIVAGQDGGVGGVPGGEFLLAGGLLRNEGTVRPGDLGEVARFFVDGEYEQTDSGTLHLDLGAEARDRLTVSGSATLAGTLAVDFIEEYRPSAMDAFVVLEAGEVSGRFANAAERLFTAAGAFDVIYGATSVTLANFDPEARPTAAAATPTPTPGAPATATPTSPATPGVGTPTPTPTQASARCAGDCGGDGTVTVNELIVGVNIALGNAALAACPVFDRNGDDLVAVNELIAAVNAALQGCS